MTRRFYVFSDDPRNKKVSLEVKVNILPFANLNPKKADLWGKTDEEVKEEIFITPQKNHEFRITNITAITGKDISYELIDLKNGQYKLIVQNIKKEPGVYSDQLFLTTDNKKHRTIRVNVFGNIK